MNAIRSRQSRISELGRMALSKYESGDRYFLVRNDELSRSFVCVLAWTRRTEDLKRVVRTDWVHPDLAGYAESALDFISPGWRKEMPDRNSFLSIPPLQGERLG